MQNLKKRAGENKTALSCDVLHEWPYCWPFVVTLENIAVFGEILKGKVMEKYIFVIEADKPPQVFINEVIPNIGKVVEMKAEALPKRVDAAWLQERFSISRKALIEKLRIFNKGTDTKHLYDPKEVMPILENLHVTNKRGARRKN